MTKRVEMTTAFIYPRRYFKKENRIINDLSSPSVCTGLQQRVSIVGEVSPVLIKFILPLEREECLTQFLPIHLLF